MNIKILGIVTLSGVNMKDADKTKMSGILKFWVWLMSIASFVLVIYLGVHLINKL